MVLPMISLAIVAIIAGIIWGTAERRIKDLENQVRERDLLIYKSNSLGIPPKDLSQEDMEK